MLRMSFIKSIMRNSFIAVGSGASRIYNLSYADELILYVKTRERNGACTIVFTIQSSPDQVNWSTVGTTLTVNAVGDSNRAVTNFGKYVRIIWTASGGTNFAGIDIYLQAKG